MQPQAAYACYVAGYLHKLTYIMRIIPESEPQLTAIDHVIRHQFIPALTGGHIVNDLERQLLALPPRLGGLGLKIFHEIAPEEYRNSENVTITLQNQILGAVDNQTGKTRAQVKNNRQRRQKENWTCF